MEALAPGAAFSLFRVVTGDNWREAMHDAAHYCDDQAYTQPHVAGDIKSKKRGGNEVKVDNVKSENGSMRSMGRKFECMTPVGTL